MSLLANYVQQFSERGECRCGRCIDRGPDRRLEGHTADMIFFDVSKREGATREVLEELIREHSGVWGDVNPLDGREHNYIELGGWIGDQGLAMQLMGLGSLLGLWQLLTPRTLLGAAVTSEQALAMAGQGLLAVVAREEAAA